MRVDEASGVSRDRTTNRLREFEFGAKLGCCDLFGFAGVFCPVIGQFLCTGHIISFTLIGGALGVEPLNLSVLVLIQNITLIVIMS